MMTRPAQPLTLRQQQTRAGLLFVLPWVISLLVFTAYPVLATAWYSFTEYNIIEPPRWIGLANYRQMFADDPAFWLALKNSAIFALISVPLKIVLALGLALLLNQALRGIGFYRTVFYLPALVPPVAATIVFMLLLSPRGGPVNTLLARVGIDAPDWFNDPLWAKPALILLALWPLGVETLTFLAGLKDIPQDLIEAAQLDGANAWQRFWGVVLPLLTPVLLFNLIIGIIGSFQVFTQALVIGGVNGEPLESTLMFVVLIYRNAFRYFSMGYAAALSVILFLLVLALSLAVLRSSRLWVHYAGESR